MDEFLGTILIWPINFAPRAWAYCHGQLLAISQNTALFSLLGTTYGGDGRTTFGLPNMQGRVAVGAGQGAGTSNYRLGEMGGNELTHLAVNNLPAHNHAANTGTMSVTIHASSGEADNPVAETGSQLATVTNSDGDAFNSFNNAGGTPDVGINTAATVTGAVTIGNTGANQAFSNVQPFLALHHIICMQGIFPPRS